MSEKMIQTMHHAVADTLENMAFTEVLAGSAESYDLSVSETIAATQQVLEPSKALFRIVMPEELVQGIAESVFSTPREKLDGHILWDIVAEILNTICGRFLNEYLPDEQEYKLGLPEPQPVDQERKTGTVQKMYFIMEGLPFFVSIEGELDGLPDRMHGEK